MPHRIRYKHDSFCKSLLSQKEMAVSFLKEYLPKNIVEKLHFDTLESLETSYLNRELKTAFSDLVWRVSTHDTQSAHICLLLEHKSYPDNFAAFQLLEYLALAYRKQLKSGADPELIIPVLYYHGDRKWEYKPLKKAFSIYPGTLTNYIPEFDTVFINLREMSVEQIQTLKNGMLRGAIMVQKHYFDPQALNLNLQNIMESLQPYLDSNLTELIFVYMIQNSGLDREKFVQIVEKLPSTLNNKVMSIYDELIQEGIEKGRVQVEEKFVKKLISEFGFTDEQAARAADVPLETVRNIRKTMLNVP